MWANCIYVSKKQKGSIALITLWEVKMKKLFRGQFLHMIAFIILCFCMMHSITFAQEVADEDLKKKYAPILGKYEFVTDGGTFILEFYIEGNDLWADSGDGRPATMESLKDTMFEFKAEDPLTGIFEIKFMKDESGEYKKCHVVNTSMGLDAKGNKIS